MLKLRAFISISTLVVISSHCLVSFSQLTPVERTSSLGPLRPISDAGPVGSEHHAFGNRYGGPEASQQHQMLLSYNHE